MQDSGYRIEIETPDAYRADEELTREAFWNVYRPGCCEHYILRRYRTRPDYVPELSLRLLLDSGELVAHIMCARSQAVADDGRIVPLMTFGPISVAPKFQRQGWGTILLRDMMERATRLGVGALAICGAIGFYGKSGFVLGSTKGLHYYAEPRENEVPYFLVKELREGFFDGFEGTYRDPDGYEVDDAEVEAFDATFPPKVKLRLPGQIF